LVFGRHVGFQVPRSLARSFRYLCAQTIYEWVDSDKAPADLRTLLPRNAASAGDATGAASAPASARSQSAQGSRNVSEAVETRDEAGPFEGDTVIGKQNVRRSAPRTGVGSLQLAEMEARSE
jgi:IS30 family transposase